MRSSIIALVFSLMQISPVYATCTGIGCTCSVSASTVAFGNIDTTSSSNVDTTGNVQVTCSVLLLGLNVSYTIDLNTGNGTFSQRKMKNASFSLNYNLYTDSARSLIWGDGTSSTSIVSDSYNLAILSMTRNYTVYGRVPGPQISAAYGSYSDTITVTVNY